MIGIYQAEEDDPYQDIPTYLLYGTTALKEF